MAGPHHAGHGRTLQGASHGSASTYLIGFGLSVVLTAAAFALLMVPNPLPKGAVLLSVAALAGVQIFVHLVCFLHMNTDSEQRWNVTAFAFAILVLAILIFGSLWIMHNVSTHMINNSSMSMPPM